MAKMLLTEKNIEEHICKETRSIYMNKDMIAPPGVKDYLQNIGIAIRYGEKPAKQASKSGEETVTPTEQTKEVEDIATLTRRIVAILRDEYQVKDEETLQALCLQVVKQMNT